MTQKPTIHQYIGLSTETKPTTGVPPSSTFEEMDTGVTYKFNSSDSTWVVANNTSAQNPISADGDPIYNKDIDLSNSDIGTFTGDLTTLFGDYQTEITDSTATNPKTYTVHLKRPIKSNTVALGSRTGDFSNVKVQLKDLAGTVRTVIDDSANGTKFTSNVYSFTTNVFIEMVIEFHTTDAVKISGMYVPKVQSRAISAIDGYVSETNTTQVVLAPGATFTGGQVDTLNYGMALIGIFADQDSATDGLSIQFRSTTSSTWREADAYTIAANSEKTFSVQTVRRFMRVVYTNGGTIQTVFDLQTVLKPVYVKPSSHRVTDPITGQDDAELVKAVITGENPGGTFVNGQFTTVGNFKTSLEERENTLILDDNLQIALGRITGVTHVNKYGQAEDGVQTTATDIWDRADASATQQIWLAPTAARIHTIVSSSTADDGTPEGAGGGAQAVRVYYLPDWDTAEASEDVILNGTAGVAMNNAAVIIHRMKIIPVGTTYNINAGNITATAAVDATITAQINIGQGQTNMAIYGIPSTQTAYATGYSLNSHNSATPATPAEVDFTLLANERPDLDTTVFINKGNLGTISSGTTFTARKYRPYRKVAGPAIVKIQAIATDADTEGVAEFDLILVDNA
jgi:hypothetical protein